MGRRWGPFGDLTVAPEVAATVGGVAALRELLATSEPTVCCQRCRKEVPIATTALSLLAQTSTDDPAEPGFIRVSFAHARCLPSLVVIDPDLADRQLDVERGPHHLHRGLDLKLTVERRGVAVFRRYPA